MAFYLFIILQKFTRKSCYFLQKWPTFQQFLLSLLFINKTLRLNNLKKIEKLWMRKFQCLLFVLKRSYTCYYIICMIVPLRFNAPLNGQINLTNIYVCHNCRGGFCKKGGFVILHQNKLRDNIAYKTYVSLCNHWANIVRCHLKKHLTIIKQPKG